MVSPDITLVAPVSGLSNQLLFHNYITLFKFIISAGRSLYYGVF